MASKKQCQRALDLHEDRLSSLNHVVGLGIVPDETPGKQNFGHVIAVYVDKKLPLAELDEPDIVPKTVQIPSRGKTVHAVKTKVIEQGQVGLERPER